MLIFIIGAFTGWFACAFFLMAIAKYSDYERDRDSFGDDLFEGIFKDDNDDDDDEEDI